MSLAAEETLGEPGFVPSDRNQPVVNLIDSGADVLIYYRQQRSVKLNTNCMLPRSSEHPPIAQKRLTDFQGPRRPSSWPPCYIKAPSPFVVVKTGYFTIIIRGKQVNIFCGHIKTRSSVRARPRTNYCRTQNATPNSVDPHRMPDKLLTTIVPERAERDGKVTCQPVQARSRVASLKRQSVRRMEFFTCNIGVDWQIQQRRI
ncbi:hypothetical protein NPIL_632381 [Nephila pilipes]|uniref:Uncharacterized protein n=1 Tax=Nephila pilipes TaxID=299642 RepID=A0A8X6QP36_NEPPI|nr:hypothetical protein NPIL_632381 [Nephila pilipes]